MNMMRRLLYVLTALLLTGAALVSCDDDETYAEQRQKERDAISAFLNRDVYICNSAGDVLIHVGKINIISEDVFNAQGQVTNVDRNEYVVFENTGVYMQIVRQSVAGRCVRSLRTRYRDSFLRFLFRQPSAEGLWRERLLRPCVRMCLQSVTVVIFPVRRSCLKSRRKARRG